MKKLIAIILILLFAHTGYCGVHSGVEKIATTTDYTKDANCMGAWYMNGVDSANEIDRSDSGETLLNLTSCGTSAVVPTGYSGKSRYFDRAHSDVLYHPDGGTTDIYGANQSLSYTLWVNLESNNGTDYPSPIAKYDNVAGALRQYITYVGWEVGDGIITYLSNDGSSVSDCHTDTYFNTGEWNHIAVVYNDVDVRIYVNGLLVSNGANNPCSWTTGIFNSTARFSLGGRLMNDGDVEFAWDGWIDEVAVFDRALSSTEVMNIKTNGIDGTRGGND
jgi:hypothetical protein